MGTLAFRRKPTKFSIHRRRHPDFGSCQERKTRILANSRRSRIARWIIFGFSIGIVHAFATGSPGISSTAFDTEMQANRLIITSSGRPVAHFVFSDQQVQRPFFAHVHTPDGIPVTRSFPPVAGVDATDHADMHPGIWIAFGDISGEDFWRNRGTIRHEKFIVYPRQTVDGVEFATVSDFVASDGNVLGQLESRLAVTIYGDGYLIEWLAILKAGKVQFVVGDQEEMGFGVRLATPIAETNGGRVYTSEGIVGASHAWGRTADWCDYSATIVGRRIGISVLSDDRNFRRSWMHTRDYGLVVANPFGRKAFTGKDSPSRVFVGPEVPLRIRFGAYVYSVLLDDSPKLSAAFKEFMGRGRTYR